jgi:hypothetical protein
MKKLILLTFIAFLSLSCSKDDDGQSVSIVNDWAIEKVGYMNASNEVTSEDDWSHDCSSKKDHMILTSSENFTFNYFSSACESTFFAQESGMYSFDEANDRLTISGGTDWDATYDVISLTETELVLKIIVGVSENRINARLGENNYYKFSRRN